MICLSRWCSLLLTVFCVLALPLLFVRACGDVLPLLVAVAITLLVAIAGAVCHCCRRCRRSLPSLHRPDVVEGMLSSPHRPYFAIAQISSVLCYWILHSPLSRPRLPALAVRPVAETFCIAETWGLLSPGHHAAMSVFHCYSCVWVWIIIHFIFDALISLSRAASSRQCLIWRCAHFPMPYLAMCPFPRPTKRCGFTTFSMPLTLYFPFI